MNTSLSRAPSSIFGVQSFSYEFNNNKKYALYVSYVLSPELSSEPLVISKTDIVSDLVGLIYQCGR